MYITFESHVCAVCGGLFFYLLVNLTGLRYKRRTPTAKTETHQKCETKHKNNQIIKEPGRTNTEQNETMSVITMSQRVWLTRGKCAMICTNFSSAQEEMYEKNEMANVFFFVQALRLAQRLEVLMG